MQSVAITTDKDNRLDFKNKLLSKVETALIPPTLPAELELDEVEIIDKYSTWVPVGSQLDSEEFSPDFKKDADYIPQHELEERASVKRGLLNKVEGSLIPVEVIEPTPIEIIEKYSNWAPACLSLEPEETLLPEFKSTEVSISPWEEEKKAAIEAALLSPKIEITPPVAVTPRPVEIIEKYSKGIPARSVETNEPFFPEPVRGDTSSRDSSFTPHSELEKRASFKSNLLNRLETALTPEQVAVEQAPVEIIEKYSHWSPSRLALKPQESLLPEFKVEETILSPYELEKRQTVLAKADQVPVAKEVKEAPVPEIIEQYSDWTPARLAIQPEDKFLPEPIKEDSFIPNRELDKRAEIKHALASKLDGILSPVIPVEVEPPVIEIIEKFSAGIPKIDPKPMDSIFEVATRSTNIPQGDIPKRVTFKDNLMKKINTLPLAAESLETIEVVGDFSQRTVVPYGLDFEDAKIPKLVVSELQESIVDFIPVDEEPVIPVLRIPENYGEMDERALYGILIRNSDLQHTSETANLTLDVLAGRSSRQVEFVIVDAPKPIIIPSANPIIKAPVIQEVFETQPSKVEIVKPIVIKEPEMVEFALPSDWQRIPLATLRTDLLSTGVTPEQVDARMAALVHKTEAPMVDKVVAENFTIDLPEEFNSWKPNSQYIYLTKERKLTPDLANSVIWEFNLEH